MIILDYILGFLFKIMFFIILVVFHPIQMMAHVFFGKKAHQKTVHYMNGAILLAFKIACTQSKFVYKSEPPIGQSYIFIANHQSLWDIVGIYWYLRAYKPIFVSKKELSKGIPSISYNLRKSGAALINRQDRKQAIKEILKMGALVHKEKSAAVIFPEGTRSKNGRLKNFSYGGITGLIKKIPDAQIIPIAIQGTANLEASKYYRIKTFKTLSWTVLDPISPKGLTPEQIAQKCHDVIKKEISPKS